MLRKDFNTQVGEYFWHLLYDDKANLRERHILMFSADTRILEYKEKRIILNALNGLWIRVSKKVYDLFALVEKEKLSFDQLLKALHDDQDREYIKSVYRKMQEIGVVEKKENVRKENRSILFEVTRRCNLHCLHCCVSAERETDFEMSFDNIIMSLNKIICWKPRQISLTGGEPLMREDIFEIFKYLNKRYDGRLTLSTNGTLINEKNVENLIHYLDQIDISIDGVDEETCSRVRGKGTFEMIVKAVRLLHKKGFYAITLSMISDKFHRKMEDEFYKLNEELGTTPIVRSFAPVGRGEKSSHLLKNDKYYDPTPIITKPLIQACSCKAGKEKFLIDYKGNIYPCQYFVGTGFCVGNILENKNFPIDISIDVMKYYFPQNYEKCSSCPVNIFCWPCPGELYLYSEANQTKNFEKICEFQKKFLYKQVWDEDVLV